MLLQIVIVSTRPGRKGDAIARWFDAQARAHAAFDAELVGLNCLSPHQIADRIGLVLACTVG